VLNNLSEGNAKLGRAERRRFLDIAIGSLAEVDGMLGVLPDIYAIEPAAIQDFESLRVRINHGLFHMLRSRPAQ
jgi:four helix bundle protein